MSDTEPHMTILGLAVLPGLGLVTDNIKEMERIAAQLGVCVEADINDDHIFAYPNGTHRIVEGESSAARVRSALQGEQKGNSNG